MKHAFFRAGVGAVILDGERRILVLKRLGVTEGAWQLPQGGIKAGERPLDTLYREIREETGLERDEIAVVREAPDWWVYELPPEYRNTKVGWGQAQRWFLCELKATPTAVRPDQSEVTAAEWVTADRLLARAVGFRVPIYRRLIAEFELR
jgi:putative (di)nucleoside polyphosphate hydrolase